MPKLRTLVFAMLAFLTLGVGEAGAQQGDTSFKDWTVVCDNLRNCEADGFAAEDAEKPAILRLTRSGAPTAPAGVAIVLMTDTDGVTQGAPLALVVDDRPVLTVPLGGEGTATLAAAQVGPLLGAARNGTALSIRRGDQEVGVVSLAGMVAALRLVDDQQRRAGTVTAMVAKGGAPVSAVPPQPAVPVVRRAPPVAQTGLPKTPPAGVKALMAKAECDVAKDSAFEGEPEVHRLSADKVLWQVPCGAGAYNFSSLFVIVDDKGGAARLAPLEGVDDGLAVNAQYDPQTRILGAYNKGRGVGDCGDSSEWAWTGQVFALTGGRFMPVCRGQADWPTSFQAKVE
jgi:hypothetical protein